MVPRTASWAAGNERKIDLAPSPTGPLARGKIHDGGRREVTIRPTFGSISGTNWIADAPLPMTATSRPVRSTP